MTDIFTMLQGSCPFFDQKFKDFFFHFSRTPREAKWSQYNATLDAQSRVSRFSSQTLEKLRWIKLATNWKKFQGLSSSNCNYQGLLRPWIFNLKRRVRTLMLQRPLHHLINYLINWVKIFLLIWRSQLCTQSLWNGEQRRSQKGNSPVLARSGEGPELDWKR